MEALRLYRKSHAKKLQGRVVDFNNTYLKALKLQAEAKAENTTWQNEENTNMLLLPHDVWVAIFRQLDLRSVGACMQVCRAWNRIARDGRIWHELYNERWQLAQQIPGNFAVQQDWYNAFWGRIHTMKYPVSASYFLSLSCSLF